MGLLREAYSCSHPGHNCLFHCLPYFSFNWVQTSHVSSPSLPSPCANVAPDSPRAIISIRQWWCRPILTDKITPTRKATFVKRQMTDRLVEEIICVVASNIFLIFFGLFRLKCFDQNFLQSAHFMLCACNGLYSGCKNKGELHLFEKWNFMFSVIMIIHFSNCFSKSL